MNRVRPLAPWQTAQSPISNRRPLLDTDVDVESASLPSEAGTAVLNLSDEQTSRIRKLLVGLRIGSAVATDVRNQIFSMLSGGQRKMLGAAYFIISVRV